MGRGYLGIASHVRWPQNARNELRRKKRTDLIKIRVQPVTTLVGFVRCFCWAADHFWFSFQKCELFAHPLLGEREPSSGPFPLRYLLRWTIGSNTLLLMMMMMIAAWLNSSHPDASILVEKSILSDEHQPPKIFTSETPKISWSWIRLINLPLSRSLSVGLTALSLDGSFFLRVSGRHDHKSYGHLFSGGRDPKCEHVRADCPLPQTFIK